MSTTAVTFQIGGSEAAAAIGLDPYRSRVALWSEKTGLTEPRSAGEPALWGNLLEPLVREQASVRENVIIGHVEGWAPVHAKLAWMTGHPDGMVTHPGDDTPTALYEGKTCGPWVKGWDDESVPAAYIAQAHHYMHLTGFEQTLFACLVGGQRLETRWIERDESFTALMLEAETEFVELCVQGTPPPPDGSKATDDVLKKLYPRAHVGTVVELTAADMVTIGVWRALKAAVKETETQMREREQAVKMRLGDNEIGVYEGSQVVSYKTVVQERKAQDARTIEYRRLV